MKGIRILLIILFAHINVFGQTCHFNVTGNYNKNPNPVSIPSCDVGFTPATATLIYIDPGVTITINNGIVWGANVIVQGTLIIEKPLTLTEPAPCNLTLSIESGGKLIDGSSNSANELLTICNQIILSNKASDNPLYYWGIDFPTGITGPAVIDKIGGTLPVELISFDAKTSGKSVILSWSTASEQNNDYFTLERSRNGKDFEVIGQVDGSGTINTTMNYTFTDDDPYLGLSFYRLSQTDFDGAFEVFPAISVIFTDKNTNFSINPNPIIDQTVNLKVSGKVKNEWFTLNIIDSQGKLVEHKTFQADYYGNVDVEFLLNKQLHKGIYIFELVSASKHEYLKVAGK